MIITLLSDFGNQDNFVGVVKGTLLRALPHARIIDLSHEVMPFHLLQCSYFLKSAFDKFPEGTLHLSLFDTMCQNPAGLLLAEVRHHFILSADNGLLPLTFGKELGKTYTDGATATTYAAWLHNVTRFIRTWEETGFSFDGLQETAAQASPIRLQPFCTGDSLECQIIHIDRYGNVVINFTREDWEHYGKGRAFTIYFSRNHTVSRLSQDYADVPEGEKVCLFNSGGFLELAINNGSAAQLFGLTLMHDRQLVYQKIKIDFS